jgi:hypothetical protein
MSFSIEVFDTFRSILLSIIFSVISLIIVVLVSAILRRIIHSRRYRKLDRYREITRVKVKNLLIAGTFRKNMEEFIALAGSLRFQAIEDVLFEFMKAAPYRTTIREFFQSSGYTQYYEKKLRSGNIITRATAIDKLGMMQSEVSVDKLVMMLKTKNTELISTAIRALSRIGTPKALVGILEHLPELYQNDLIGHKTVETSLRSFGIAAQPVLVEHGVKFTDTRILSSILEVMSNMPSTDTSASFAVHYLNNPDVEVRAKALKLIGRSDPSFLRLDYTLLLQYLSDPVWFIRLHAAKALGKLRFQGALDNLGKLLLDPNWQVRSAATAALIQFGDVCLDIFLKALKDKDDYVKQSICEEIEKSNFVFTLIENLSADRKETFGKSQEILMIMHRLNFSTPLMEYMDRGKNEIIKTEMRSIMVKEKDEKK